MTLRIGGLSPTIVSTATSSSMVSRNCSVLVSQPPLLERAPHQVAEFVRIDRLGDVVEGALLQGPHRGVHRGEGGDHDHGDLRVDAVDVLLQFHAVHAGHLDVEQRHVVPFVLQRLQRLGGVLRRRDLVAVLAEPVIERVADRELVVDDQDACGLRRGMAHDLCRLYGLPVNAVRFGGCRSCRRPAASDGWACRGSRRWNVVPRPTLRVDLDPSPVPLHDAVHDGQAEPHAALRFLGREERLENLRQHFGRNAHARVADVDPDLVGVAVAVARSAPLRPRPSPFIASTALTSSATSACCNWPASATIWHRRPAARCAARYSPSPSDAAPASGSARRPR